MQGNVIPSCVGISFGCSPRRRQQKRAGGFHNVPCEHSVQSCTYNTVTFSLSRHTSLFSVRHRSDHRMESRDYAPMVAGVAHGSEGECSHPMRSHLQPWIVKTKRWLIHVHVEQMENMENRGKTTQDIGRCRLNVGHIYSVFCGLGFYWLNWLSELKKLENASEPRDTYLCTKSSAVEICREKLCYSKHELCSTKDLGLGGFKTFTIQFSSVRSAPNVPQVNGIPHGALTWHARYFENPWDLFSSIYLIYPRALRKVWKEITWLDEPSVCHKCNWCKGQHMVWITCCPALQKYQHPRCSSRCLQDCSSVNGCD